MSLDLDRSVIACPVCGAERLRDQARTTHLTIRLCAGCGHSVAEHARVPEAEALDYHRQYDQFDFVEALARTRRRQSKRIVALIKQHFPEAASIVDFGSGRGWFLDSAREAGFARLVGMDTSALAIDLLRERGLEGVLIPISNESVTAPPRLSFRPDVLVVLDVVEHFSPDNLKAQLGALVQGLRPKLMIVKVPVSDGLLYRLARMLAAVGSEGPLERLYQVGTYPPHWNYFSRRSLAELLEQSGLVTIDQEPDRDFEARELTRRVQSLRRLGKFGHVFGAIAAGIAAFGLQDSLIAVSQLKAE